MKPKRIVFRYPNGELYIASPSPRSRLEGEPEAMWLDRIAMGCARPIRDGAVRVDTAGVPAEWFAHEARRFRACWRWVPGAANPVQVDVILARQQRLAEVREERNARLLASDADRARLEDIGSQEQRNAMRVYRQSLRDLPNTVQAELDAIATWEGLAAYTPPWPQKPE